MDELALLRRNNDRQPVNTLPTELINDIFEIAHESAEDPVRFSGICARWRETALSLPSIWKKVAISAVDSNRDTTLEYMRRSGDYLLDVTIAFPDVGGDGLPPALVGSLNLLAESSHRIRYIGITMHRTSPHLWESLDFSAPNLVKLECRGLSGPLADRRWLPETLFRNETPELRDVSLYNLSTEHCNFRNLTTLNLISDGVGINQDVFYGILNVCPHLQYLTVCRFTFTHSGWIDLFIPHTSTRIDLPLLESLTLIDTEIRSIVARLSTPNLLQLKIRMTTRFVESWWFLVHLHPISVVESLTIDVIQHETEGRDISLVISEKIVGTLTVDHITTISEYLLRAFTQVTLPNLRHLTFGTNVQELSAPSARGSLKALSSVEKITVTGTRCDSILSSLISEGSDTDVCPRLEELTILITPRTYQSVFTTIRDIVVSRGGHTRIGCMLSASSDYDSDDLKSKWEECCVSNGIMTIAS